MRFRSATLVPLALSSLLATPAHSDAQASMRDSAGIRIVETRTAPSESAFGWRLSARPLLQIGIDEGEPEYLFSRIAGAIRLPDGRVVVADGASNQVRFYDRTGKFIRAVGRKGAGPGEYEYIRSLKHCVTDSIFAFDLNWQLKVYTLNGELERETKVVQPGGARTPYALNCSSAGKFVITGWGTPPTHVPIGLHTATAPVYVLSSAGEKLVELGPFISSERIGTERGSRPHPFGRSTLVALGPDEIYVGTSESFEVRAYALDGKLRRILRGPRVDLQIRPEHLQRYRSDQLASVSADRRPAFERELRDLPMTKQFPAYSELQLDPGGNLWVRRFQRPGDPQRVWAVFSQQGVFLGDVRTPASVTILEIGNDYVVGVGRDEFGVERVLVYALQKPRA